MKRLVFDIETNPINFKTGDILGQAHTVHCIVIYDLNTKQYTVCYDTDELRRLGTVSISTGLRMLAEADEIIGHNILQFDLPVLRELYQLTTDGKVTDTLVCSRLFYPDRPGGHSLREWGERLGYPKGKHQDFETFSPAMLEYCQQDVEVTAKVYNYLEQERKNGSWDRALNLEHRFADVMARQEQVGMHFNRLRAEVYIKLWSKQIYDLDRFILDGIPNRVVPGRNCARPFKINGDLSASAITASTDHGIPTDYISGPFQGVTYVEYDLGSPAQQKIVLDMLGWRPKYWTETGTPQIEDESVSAVGPKGVSLLQRNRLKTWRDRLLGIVEISDRNSRVHGGGNPCGTPTARVRHSRIANIPRITSPFGREMRSLFGAKPGNLLVGYDAAALELRILAHYIGSEDYGKAVCSRDKSNDAHILAARAAGSDDRDLGKTINYALIYGAGDPRLGRIIGGTANDGADLRLKLYRRIPGLQTLVNHVKTASNRGFLIGLDGRKLFLRPRVSPLNTLVQAGGAVFMKTVAAKLDLYTLLEGMEARKVLDMHDEAQWECPPEEVPLLEKLIHQAFKDAAESLGLRCPQEAEVKVGRTWEETH